MINVGGYLGYRMGCSVPWGYHEYRGGYPEYREVYPEYRGNVQYLLLFEYRGDVQYLLLFDCRADIMIHMGDIMNTVGVFSTVEVLK